jgi:hypothetical protein
MFKNCRYSVDLPLFLGVFAFDFKVFSEANAVVVLWRLWSSPLFGEIQVVVGRVR